jgi:hypothetical protein
MKAFPTDRLGVIQDTRGISINQAQQDGMDLRDYFAAEAMQGLLLDINSMEPEQTATLAYLYADAMMKERQK